MDNLLNGINRLLWFIHRTVFEHIPALLTLAFLYFFFKSCRERCPMPEFYNAAIRFFEADSQGFIKAVVLIALVVLMHSVISAIGDLLISRPAPDMINIEDYPYYKIFKNKINNDLGKQLDKDITFNPTHIYRIVRYEIMQNKKEFDTFLWYDSTKHDMFRNFVVCIGLVAVLVLPLYFEKVNYGWLFSFSVTVHVVLCFVVAKKFKHINDKEKKLNDKDDAARETLYIPNICDCIAALMLLTGMMLMWICAYKNIEPGTKDALMCMGINMVLFFVSYMFLVYEFLENKHFTRGLVDAYISMRYEKEIFNKR